MTGTSGEQVQVIDPSISGDPQPPIPNPQRLKTWLPRILGTLIFLGVLLVLDLTGTLPVEDILATLRGADPWLVAFSIALYVPFLVLKAERWRIVAEGMHMPITRPDAWRIYAIGLAAGTFTPGQAGDAVKAWFLQRKGYPLSRGLGSSALDRLFDVAALALLGLLGIAVYGRRFSGQTPALVALALACLFVVVFFSVSRTRTWAVNIVGRRLSRFTDQRSTVQTFEDSNESWSLGPGRMTSAGILTALSFVTSIFRVWLLAAALGIFFGPLEVSGFVGLTTAAALVPVTVGGVGTREVVATLALAQLGHSAAEAVALSILILLLNFVQAVVGWIVWVGSGRQQVAGSR